MHQMDVQQKKSKTFQLGAIKVERTIICESIFGTLKWIISIDRTVSRISVSYQIKRYSISLFKLLKLSFPTRKLLECRMDEL